MAIFGLQIVISLVVFCFLTKLTKYYSFGRWLLCKGLFLYWPPTNDEFKQAIKQRYAKESNNKSKKQSNISKSYHKTSSINNNDSPNTAEEFPIPTDTSIELKLIPLIHHDVIQVKYVDEFFSLVDFISGSIIIFLLTEFYLYITPIIRQNTEHLNELNLSLFWCSISLLLSLTILTKFVREYLKVDEGILCIIFGALSFLLALCLQYIDEKFFDFNLKETYGNRTIVYNDDNDEERNYFDRRFIYIVMLLAFVNAYQSIILFFPAFRFGQLQYLLLMKNKTKENLKQIFIFILTLINFILPIFICLLWFKPIIEHFNENHLLKLKIFSISFCILLRICLFKPYIQIYLDTAFDRVKILYDQQQLTTTRITNLSYQRNVRSIFLYLGVVVCQYILPAFIQLIICFYLKIFSDNKSNLTMNSSPPKWLQNFDNYMMNTTNTNSSLILTWNDMKTLFNNQHIAVFISYLLFWHHAIFCLISCGSLIYNTYIQREQHIKND
jgi:hypothetical protein